MGAGYGLGLSYGKVMRYIILPQAFKNILPAMGNEFITLVKRDFLVGAYIGIVELTKRLRILLLLELIVFLSTYYYCNYLFCYYFKSY